jgi:hypothetical protein
MLTAIDLLLPDDELTQITGALENLGIADPISQKCAEVAELFAQYTARYVIGDENAKRLQRPLIIYELYALIGAATETIAASKDAALQELRDIRDGKFPNLELAEEQPSSPAGRAAWGSKIKIAFPGDE